MTNCSPFPKDVNHPVAITWTRDHFDDRCGWNSDRDTPAIDTLNREGGGMDFESLSG